MSNVVKFPAKGEQIDVATLRLEDARKFQGCVLMLGCEICGYRKGYNVWKVTRRLFDLGDGGFMTPVADVAGMIKFNCPDCGGRHWYTQLAYPHQLAGGRPTEPKPPA